MPRRASKQKAVLPPLLIDIQAHIHIPALPIPHPTWIRYLCVRDVDGRGFESGILPWCGVDAEVPQRFRGEEWYSKHEPAALVLVKYVDVGVGRSRGLDLLCRGVVAVGVVDELDVLLRH